MKLHSQRHQTLQEIRDFLAGSGPLDFSIPDRKEAYDWIESALRQLRYLRLGKADKGMVRDYLIKVSGLSRAQVTRLIKQFRDTGHVRDHRGRPANAFVRRYQPVDVALLAEVDALHGTLSGPATRKLCERSCHVFGDLRFERLAHISNGHLYNLRHSAGYQRRRRHVDKTRPSPVRIGERRKPFPDGRPGFLRVDTVHQGDLDGIKGLYHVNAVDEVTQMQVIVSVERISERYLLPSLEQLLDAFPFVILGFLAEHKLRPDLRVFLNAENILDARQTRWSPLVRPDRTTDGRLTTDVWAPLETNTTLYDHHWFWAPEKEKKRKSLEHLMDCYYQSVGYGSAG